MVSQLSLFIIAFLPVLCHISIFTQVLLRENTVVFLQHNLALPDIKPSKQPNKNWKKNYGFALFLVSVAFCYKEYFNLYWEGC